MRLQRALLGYPLHLGNDDAAIVAGRKRLVEAAEIGALVFIGEIAALVGGRRADDRHLRRDRLEIKPVLALEGDLLHHRFGSGGRIHGAAFARRVDEGVEPDFGHYAGTLRRRLAMHVEENAGGNIVGCHLVRADHLPDQRRFGARRTGRIGASDDLFQETLPGDVVHALDAAHVAGGYRMQRRQIARVSGRLEALADRLQHQVRAAKPAGGGDRNDCAVRNQAGSVRKRNMFARHAHQSPVSISTAPPVAAALTTARPVASDQTPSSPLADGRPLPPIAEWKAAIAVS